MFLRGAAALDEPAYPEGDGVVGEVAERAPTSMLARVQKGCDTDVPFSWMREVSPIRARERFLDFAHALRLIDGPAGRSGTEVSICQLGRAMVCRGLTSDPSRTPSGTRSRALRSREP